MQSNKSVFCTTITRASITAVAAMTMLAAGAANAQLPVPASSQFDITGFIQEATLDPACAANAHCGGTIKVMGHTIVIPKETEVMYPLNVTTWQEMFAQAPAPYGLAALQANGTVGASGLALNDLPLPLTTYEAHIQGNRVLGGAAGADLYIAGLVYIAPSGLNSGAGFINFIDYALGEMRVGGVVNDPNCAQGGTALTNPLCSGARVRINDPAGRFGRVNSPDVRFTTDPENPSVIAGTGYPMCLPRTDPSNAAVPEDAQCFQAQRPKTLAANGSTVFQTAIDMNDPRLPGLAGVPPDANFQVPFEVGDYVTFAGITVTDNAAAPTAGPWPTNGAAGTYISAYQITNNVGIWTAPGANPAYVEVEVTLIGTGGLTVLGAGEAVVRTRFEGMTTDPSRTIHLYGVDFDPKTGATSDRDYGMIGVDPGAPVGAVRGRWRFRPPCAPFGTDPATIKFDKACIMNSGNTFLPPPRDVRAVIEGAWLPNAPAGTVAPTAANGITWGQFRQPITEFIFPENVPGTPIVPNNFNTIPFLVNGGYPSSTGVIPAQLNPWPDSSIPTASCTPATATAGGPYTVANGGSVALNGTAGGTGPFTFAWSVDSGSVAPANTATTTFSAVGATSPVTATLTVTGACGTASASASITVDAPLAPTVATVAPLSAFTGARGSFTLTATDPNVPAQSVTFKVTQTGGPALATLAVLPVDGTSATVNFTAPLLPAGTTAAAVITLSATATNVGGSVSAPATITITVKPIPDQIAITAAQYRTGKQRIDLTVTSSIDNPAVVLTLQPYVTASGATFDPSLLGNVLTYTGAATYTLTLVGAPEPAIPPATPLVVTSSLGGRSPATALTSIRN